MAESATPNPESRPETTNEPHTTSVVVWDIPSAIVAGERFSMKVGVKCEEGCDHANSGFEVSDHEGARVAVGTSTGEVWPGTTGLHAAEVALVAPASEGLYTWNVKSFPSEDEIPHVEGSASFGIRVVSQPEYLVTIEAVDEADHAPLSGARVVMHPYRAVTDERGVAHVRVAKGAYRLFVSQTRYVTFVLPIEVTADVTAKAELSVEPVLERN